MTETYRGVEEFEGPIMSVVHGGVTLDLVIAAIACSYAGLLLSLRFCRPPVAVLVTFIKVTLPFAYFGWIFDGSWTHWDDWAYLHEASELLEQFGVLELVFTRDGISALVLSAGGSHFAYTWWNVLAQSLFGEHYYSAIFLNIILTFSSALYLYSLSGLLGFSIQYRRMLSVYFALHIEVLTWSSLVNLKESLVILLTLGAFYHFFRFLLSKSRIQLLLFLLFLFLFLWLRFYLSFLVFVSIGLWLVIHAKIRSLFYVVPVALLCLVFISGRVKWEILHPGGVVVGLIRFALTPQPWGIDPSYTYLTLASSYNLLLFFPMLFGGVLLWRRSREIRVLLLYASLLWGLYSVLPLLQGPRHRHQLIFIMAWCQFHFIWAACMSFFSASKSGDTEDPSTA